MKLEYFRGVIYSCLKGVGIDFFKNLMKRLDFFSYEKIFLYKMLDKILGVEEIFKKFYFEMRLKVRMRMLELEEILEIIWFSCFIE